jgi:Restriction endonuclease/Topoisomerase DNA binding C4 zinc finger
MRLAFLVGVAFISVRAFGEPPSRAPDLSSVSAWEAQGIRLACDHDFRVFRPGKYYECLHTKLPEVTSTAPSITPGNTWAAEFVAGGIVILALLFFLVKKDGKRLRICRECSNVLFSAAALCPSCEWKGSDRQEAPVPATQAERRRRAARRILEVGSVALFVLWLLLAYLKLWRWFLLGWAAMVVGSVLGPLALKFYGRWEAQREPCPHGIKGAGFEPARCDACESRLHEEELRRMEEVERLRIARVEAEERLRTELEAVREQHRLDQEERQREFSRNLRSIAFLQSLEPMAFQRLVWRAYERSGYRVRETSMGRDGGVDGFLEREGRTLVLQCKRYRYDVGEPTVRDLFGTAQHHRAAGAVLVTTGKITEPARSFCEGKDIALLDGEALLSFLEAAQVTADLVPEDFVATEVPRILQKTGTCPKCGGDLGLRQGRRGPFIGCSNFPSCRYTRDGRRLPRR